MSIAADLSADFVDPAAIFHILHTHYAATLPFLHPAPLHTAHRHRHAAPSPPAILLLAATGLACLTDPALARRAAAYLHTASPHPAHYFIRRAREALRLDAPFDPAAWTPAGFVHLQAFLLLAMCEWLGDRAPAGPARLARWLAAGRGVGKALDLWNRRLAVAGDNNNNNDDDDDDNGSDGLSAPASREACARTVVAVFLFERLLTTTAPPDVHIDIAMLPLAYCSSEPSFDPPSPSPPAANALPYGPDCSLTFLVRATNAFSEIAWFTSTPAATRNGLRAAGTPQWHVLAAQLSTLDAAMPSALPDARSQLLALETRVLLLLARLLLFRDRVPFIAVAPFAAAASPAVLAAAHTAYAAAAAIVRLVEAAPAPAARSPAVALATWHAAMASLHALHFPHLDVRAALLPPDYACVLNYGLTYNSRLQGISGRAFTLLGRLTPPWQRADRWRRAFRWLNAFLHAARAPLVAHLLTGAPLPTAHGALADGGARAWDVLRSELLGLGVPRALELRSALDDDDDYDDDHDGALAFARLYAAQFPCLPPVAAPQGMPLAPNYAGCSADSDVLSAWVLHGDAAGGGVAARPERVREMWALAGFAVPDAWSPLAAVYPATRVWAWTDGGAQTAAQRHARRRVAWIESEMRMRGFAFPQHVQGGRVDGGPRIAWSVPAPQVARWDADKEMRGMLRGVEDGEDNGGDEDDEEEVLPELVPREWVQQMPFNSDQFVCRCVDEADIEPGPATVPWDTPLYLTAPSPPDFSAITKSIPRLTPPAPAPAPVPPAPIPAPARPARPSSLFIPIDPPISTWPTPATAIPSPFDSAHMCDGHYIHAGASPATRVAKPPTPAPAAQPRNVVPSAKFAHVPGTSANVSVYAPGPAGGVGRSNPYGNVGRSRSQSKSPRDTSGMWKF